MWPIIGIWVWPNPSPLATSYDGEITALKNWIRYRLAWLDDSIPGICIDHTTITEYSHLPQEIKIYPNPSGTNNIYIESPSGLTGEIQLEIFDYTGNCVRSVHFSEVKNTIVLSPVYTEGLYMIRITSRKNTWLGKIIIE